MGKPVWEDSFNDALDTDATIHGYITVTPLQLDRTNRAVFNSLQHLNP
jgi:broad specificity polyphosphatase/5'/3'-nucleotidase SurE